MIQIEDDCQFQYIDWKVISYGHIIDQSGNLESETYISGINMSAPAAIKDATQSAYPFCDAQ